MLDGFVPTLSRCPSPPCYAEGGDSREHVERRGEWRNWLEFRRQSYMRILTPPIKGSHSQEFQWGIVIPTPYEVAQDFRQVLWFRRILNVFTPEVLFSFSRERQKALLIGNYSNGFAMTPILYVNCTKGKSSWSERLCSLSKN